MLEQTSIQPNNNGSARPNGLIRKLLRALLFLFLFLIVVLVGAVFVGYYYQDEVKEYVVGELNKQLNTQIIVDGKDIEFTVIKNFPYASVDFKNVKALDAVEQKNKDTLFTAGRISFQFNLVDIFKKQYDIKKIQLDNASVEIRIDKNGNDNYHILKPITDSVKTAFSFALKKIVFNEIALLYKNAKTHQSIDLIIKKSISSGKFSNNTYTLETTSELFVSEFNVDKVNYLNRKNVVLKAAVDVNNVEKKYILKNGKLTIENLIFDLAGSITNKGGEPDLSITVKGEDMNIRTVLSLVPEKFKNKINDYKSSGEFYFEAAVNGRLSKQAVPQITASFGIKDAQITHTPNHIELTHVNLKGHYYSGNKAKNDPSTLEIKQFTAAIESGSINGEITLKDLNAPFVTAQLKANTSLTKIQDFIKIDTLENIDGMLNADISFAGNIRELKENNYQNIVANGSVKLENMNLKIKNNRTRFTNVNGDFTFNNDDIVINSFNGNVSKSDIQLKGVLKNSIGFILRDNQDITIEAALYSKNLDLNELLANKEEYTSAKNKYRLKFSEHVNVNFNSTIEHLEFRKFEANAIKGAINIHDKKMSIDTLSLNTLGGRINLGGLVDAADSSKILVTCFSDLSNINITKLFTAFENFDQTVVEDKNIKGVVSAKVQFASVFSPELAIDLDKLYAGVDMTIEKGELNKIESFKKLSRFVELTDLENVRFNVLKNQLEIKNKLITIPKMEIRSNALDFYASGTHSFENVVDYKIKLSLNDLLAKKIRKPKKQDNTFGEVADDGLGRTNIYLTMKGPMENPVIRYDAKSAVESIKQDLKVEKQTLKQILKDEFGLFKKDTTLQKNSKTKKEDESKFIIKWEEADVKEEKKELKKPQKPIEDDF